MSDKVNENEPMAVFVCQCVWGSPIPGATVKQCDLCYKDVWWSPSTETVVRKENPRTLHVICLTCTGSYWEREKKDPSDVEITVYPEQAQEVLDSIEQKQQAWKNASRN